MVTGLIFAAVIAFFGGLGAVAASVERRYQLAELRAENERLWRYARGRDGAIDRLLERD